ncbi:hypothetical protein BGZ94_001844, partial [Podila epigama]
MLRLAKSLPFFHAQEESPAQQFLAPSNGYNITVPTRHGLESYYGPGTVFQGQLNLQLIKPIKGPCRLRVVLACTYTSGNSASLNDPNNPPASSPTASLNASPRPSNSSETSSHKGQIQPSHQRTLFE